MKTRIYVIGNRKIEISNLDKKFFPKDGYTKEAVVEYYRKIAPVMLPHIRNHPLTLVRAPDGLRGEIFFQQKIPEYFPDWVDRITVKKTPFGKITHVLCNDEATLVYLAGQAFVTLHAWPSVAKRSDKPSFIIFDLDPPDGKGFEMVRSTAFAIKKYFDKMHVKTFVMTTGSRGLHIVIPLVPNASFQLVKKVARKVASDISMERPEISTDQLRKIKRVGRVFIDWTRNAYGQNTVAPYSIRLLPGAPVATPISWGELKDPRLGARTYNIKNVFLRLRKGDAWKNISLNKYDIKKIEKLIN